MFALVVGCDADGRNRYFRTGKLLLRTPTRPDVYKIPRTPVSHTVKLPLASYVQLVLNLAATHMTARPQTIQIFLPQGVPHGIRIAELTTRIVQVIEVPRKLLKDFIAMPECQRVDGAVYLLYGEDDTGRSKVYIGQTGTLATRLDTHHKEKEFWEKALVIVSKTGNLTPTHTLYLESLCIQGAQKAKRYLTENGNRGSKPHTPAPLQADCDEIFDTARTLLATLGYAVFDPVLPTEVAESETIYFCTRERAKAEGTYTSEGFVVRKGSTTVAEVAPAFARHNYHRLYASLIEQGVLMRQDGLLVFTEDHLFKSPSAASAVVRAQAGAPKYWKTADGRTLEEVEQAKISELPRS